MPMAPSLELDILRRQELQRGPSDCGEIGAPKCCIDNSSVSVTALPLTTTYHRQYENTEYQGRIKDAEGAVGAETEHLQLGENIVSHHSINKRLDLLLHIDRGSSTTREAPVASEEATGDDRSNLSCHCQSMSVGWRGRKTALTCIESGRTTPTQSVLRKSCQGRFQTGSRCAIGRDGGARSPPRGKRGIRTLPHSQTRPKTNMDFIRNDWDCLLVTATSKVRVDASSSD